MSIPVVKTAIAPHNGMPAHPAPSAAAMNIFQISVAAEVPAAHTVSDSTSLIQIRPTADVIFYTDKVGEDFTPDFGIPLSAGGYFSFSVDAGCMLHFSSEKPALVYILEG